MPKKEKHCIPVDSQFDEHGHEIPDNTPLEIPVGFHLPESLETTIARLVRAESIRAADKGVAETFEESDDFDLDEENTPISGYQMTDLIEEAPHLSKQTGDETKTMPHIDPDYQAFMDWKTAQAKAQEAQKNSAPPAGA